MNTLIRIIKLPVLVIGLAIVLIGILTIFIGAGIISIADRKKGSEIKDFFEDRHIL